MSSGSAVVLSLLKEMISESTFYFIFATLTNIFLVFLHCIGFQNFYDK